MSTDTRPTCPQCGTELFYENAVPTCPNCDCDRAGDEAERSIHDDEDTDSWVDDEDEMEREIIDDILHDEAAERLDAEDEAAIDAALDGDPLDDVLPDLKLE